LRPSKKITITIYRLAVSIDIISGLMDHNKNQWCLDAHSGGTTDRVKTVELVPNKGYFGQYHTAFHGEIEAIADIMDFVNQNEIPEDLTFYSDA
jgi:hypothetical protein